MIETIILKSIIIKNNKIIYTILINKIDKYDFFVEYYNLENIKLSNYSEGIISLIFIICINNCIKFIVDKTYLFINH